MHEAFEHSVEYTFEGVLWVKKGKIVRCNDQFERIFQINALDVVGLPLLLLVHPLSREQVRAIIEKMERRVVSHYGGVRISLQHPVTLEIIPIIKMGFNLYRTDGEVEVSIVKMMKATNMQQSNSSILKWMVKNWPNLAAMLAAIVAGLGVLYQKASQLVQP